MDHSEVSHLKRCECGLHHGYSTHEQWEARHSRPKVDHTPAELSPERKLMLSAANLLEKSGLCKWVFCDDRGRMCLRGALAAAAGFNPDQFRYHEGAHIEADKLMAKALGSEESDGAAEWTNAPERTVDEVVAKLRAVALGL